MVEIESLTWTCCKTLSKSFHFHGPLLFASVKCGQDCFLLSNGMAYNPETMSRLFV